jgi:translation initiation factor IF-1
MPKKPSIKKGAAALFQNGKEIAKAYAGQPVIFGAVTKSLGNGAFSIFISSKRSVQATPRGLFTKGSMRIDVGQVVIVQGEPYGKYALEIVARLDSKTEIDNLVKENLMAPEVLSAAVVAGSVQSQVKVAGEDIFESSDEDEEFWEKGVADMRGGVKAERTAKETAASIAARLGSLKCGRGKQVDGGLLVGDSADPLLLAGLNDEFRAWRLKREQKAVSMGGGGSSGSSGAAKFQTEAQVWEEIEAETLRAADAEEQAAIVSSLRSIAHAAEVKAFLETRKVKENWDDVDIEEL